MKLNLTLDLTKVQGRKRQNEIAITTLKDVIAKIEHGFTIIAIRDEKENIIGRLTIERDEPLVVA